MKTKRKKTAPKIDDILASRIAKMYWLGSSARSIAKNLETSTKTVFKAIKSEKAQKVFDELDSNEIDRAKQDRTRLSCAFEDWLMSFNQCKMTPKKEAHLVDLIKSAMPFLIKETTEQIQNQKVSPEVIKFMQDLKNEEDSSSF